MIASESDPTSLLWTGHVTQGDYVTPRIMQPDQLDRMLSSSDTGNRLWKHDLRPSESILLPGEVTRARQDLEMALDADEDPDLAGKVARLQLVSNGGVTVSGDGSVEKGVRVGPHWFEVVPRNKVQTDLIRLTTKYALPYAAVTAHELREHEDLHAMVQELRVWLELEIPLVEDGNSFGKSPPCRYRRDRQARAHRPGAEVQNSLIRELELAYKKSNNHISTTRQHHTDRIRLVTEWIKYPNVMVRAGMLISRMTRVLTRDRTVLQQSRVQTHSTTSFPARISAPCS
jgi:hypothetical protein